MLPVPCGAWCWPETRRVPAEKLPAPSLHACGGMLSRAAVSSCWASILPRSVPTCATSFSKCSWCGCSLHALCLRSTDEGICPGFGGGVAVRRRSSAPGGCRRVVWVAGSAAGYVGCKIRIPGEEALMQSRVHMCVLLSKQTLHVICTQL